MNHQPLSIVVLISGNGSNLQAIIDAITCGLPVKIVSVISNQSSALGLKRAQQMHIPTHVIAHENYSSREDFDAALTHIIDQYTPQLVVLAGFMRKLGAKFVHHYHQRLINIHPSLLPKHKGLHTHREVLAMKEEKHGTTVHYVTEDVDSGPIIGQATLRVSPDDTEETLQQRVHALEHILYPQVLAWIAAGRLQLQDNIVYFDKQPLPKSGKRI